MDDKKKPEPFSLSRWSRRKLDAARAIDATPGEIVPAVAPERPGHSPPATSTPAGTSTNDGTPDLPPVDSLNLESDFSAFLRPGVDEGLRRRALRKLFSDPQFNVMDGLDVYIDDYNKTVPIPDDVLSGLAHARYLFDPPRTRVNAQGFVEDVPSEETDGRGDAAQEAAPEALAAPDENRSIASDAPDGVPVEQRRADREP